MPKGQVTDEELATGLRSMGGLSSLAPVKRDSPFRDSRSEAKTVEVPARTRVPRPIETVEKAGVEPSVTSPEPKSRAVEKPVRSERRKTALRKADLCSERVTVQMPPEMRDEVDSLARELQRSKVTKAERITANSVMRVAIRHFLDEFKLRRRDGINTEDELLAEVKKQTRAEEI